MKNEVKEKLVEAISILAAKISTNVSADDALKYTQASLNAAHTIRCLTEKESI